MNILICPLDWGLGHATRCHPVIKELENLGHHLIIGASGPALDYLKSEFPQLDVRYFRGYSMKYPDSKYFVWFFLLKLPGIFLSIIREHSDLKRWVKEHNVDIVISDNRYGLFHKTAQCVFITHQLFIKCPDYNLWVMHPGKWGEFLLHHLVKAFLTRFHQVWVPDYAGYPNLAGGLCHGSRLPDNCHFINPLSRFSDFTGAAEHSSDESINYLAVISGPEPHRGIFEQLLIEQMVKLKGKRVIVRGLVNNKTKENQLQSHQSGLELYNHLDITRMRYMLDNASCIICRSGYSTIMDLMALNKQKVLFIPTPGQTEQEYLARHLENLKVAPWQPQDALNLNELEAIASAYKGFCQFESTEGHLRSLLGKLSSWERE